MKAEFLQIDMIVKEQEQDQVIRLLRKHKDKIVGFRYHSIELIKSKK